MSWRRKAVLSAGIMCLASGILYAGSPTKAVREYIGAVWERDYETAWCMLTKGRKRELNTFKDFKEREDANQFFYWKSHDAAPKIMSLESKKLNEQKTEVTCVAGTPIPGGIGYYKQTVKIELIKSGDEWLINKIETLVP